MARPTAQSDLDSGQRAAPASMESAKQEFARDSLAFAALLPELLRTRPGLFVAVYQGQVIDEDEDEFALARRMEVSHRRDFVLIRRVCEEEEEDNMLSPEAGAPTP